MESLKEDTQEVGPCGGSLAGGFQPHPSAVWAMPWHLLSSRGLCVKTPSMALSEG